MKKLYKEISYYDRMLLSARASFISGREKMSQQAGRGLEELVEGYRTAPDIGLPTNSHKLNTIFRGRRFGKFYLYSSIQGGGKSRIAMGDAGKIQAYDIHESKLSLIESGAMRLGLSSVFASVCDATAPDESLFGTADAIICDVPCSGLGVLGKKPDIRHKDLDELKELPELQYSILSASARYLKPGGRMIYSTCTLLPEENREVVDRFLSENPGYHTADFEISGELSRDGSFTFLPHIHGTDGFFVTLIEKK